MRRSILFLAAALALAAFPDAAAAQSRSADGWWDWAARSERTARTDRNTPRTERRTERRTDRRTERRATRDRAERQTTRRTERRTERREDIRRDRREERRRAERRADRRGDDDDWDDDRYEDRGERRRKNGPKFCQNGSGHPTKGMQWCRDKGYADRGYDRRYERRSDRRMDRRTERRRDRRDDRWERRTIEDIIFGTPRDRNRRTRTVNRSVLGDVLGRRAYSQLERAANGPLIGRWVYPDATSRVLQLRDSRGPLAELTDFDGDNWVDLFLVDRTR